MERDDGIALRQDGHIDEGAGGGSRHIPLQACTGTGVHSKLVVRVGRSGGVGGIFSSGLHTLFIPTLFLGFILRWLASPIPIPNDNNRGMCL